MSISRPIFSRTTEIAAALGVLSLVMINDAGCSPARSVAEKKVERPVSTPSTSVAVKEESVNDFSEAGMRRFIQANNIVIESINPAPVNPQLIIQYPEGANLYTMPNSLTRIEERYPLTILLSGQQFDLGNRLFLDFKGGSNLLYSIVTVEVMNASERHLWLGFLADDRNRVRISTSDNLSINISRPGFLHMAKQEHGSRLIQRYSRLNGV